MPLRTLVIIALRMYAIYWLTEGMSELIVAIPVFLSLQEKLGTGAVMSSYIWIPAGLIFMAAVLWVLAAKFAMGVTKGYDTQLVFTTLTRHDFYLFAFVFLGVFFALSSVAPTIQAGYRFFEYELPLADNARSGQYLIPFVGHALTLMAGFACVYGARKWTHLLIQWDNKYSDDLEARRSVLP